MSGGDIVFWTWVAGYAWLWRYHVGYALGQSGDDDGIDFAFALFFGTMFCLVWPVMLAGRGSYVLWHKYGADNTNKLGSFFPGPKEIETREEKRERKMREERAAIQAARREINEYERENGMELTKW